MKLKSSEFIMQINPPLSDNLINIVILIFLLIRVGKKTSKIEGCSKVTKVKRLIQCSKKLGSTIIQLSLISY